MEKEAKEAWVGQLVQAPLIDHCIDSLPRQVARREPGKGGNDTTPRSRRTCIAGAAGQPRRLGRVHLLFHDPAQSKEKTPGRGACPWTGVARPGERRVSACINSVPVVTHQANEAGEASFGGVHLWIRAPAPITSQKSPRKKSRSPHEEEAKALALCLPWEKEFAGQHQVQWHRCHVASRRRGAGRPPPGELRKGRRSQRAALAPPFARAGPFGGAFPERFLAAGRSTAAPPQGPLIALWLPLDRLPFPAPARQKCAGADQSTSPDARTNVRGSAGRAASLREPQRKSAGRAHSHGPPAHVVDLENLSTKDTKKQAPNRLIANSSLLFF